MYGPLIVDIEGTHVSNKEHAILKHRNVGGVILFTRNYQSISQLKSLVKEIRNIAGKPLLIMTDHEGGRIWRFKQDFNRTPAANSFGITYEINHELAMEQASNAGKTIATELVNCGIDLTLAPVLDLNLGRSNVIGDRSFHANPIVVTKLAKAFIAGLSSMGMAAVGKHFPGHGYCSIDTHDAIGKDNRTLDEIINSDLIPFENLHASLQGIMPAHVIYSNIDDKSAGFSKYWLQNILREKVGFSGAIMSDCLSMKGTGDKESFTTKTKNALSAGCDLVILSQQSREALYEILESLDWEVTLSQSYRISGLAADFTETNSKAANNITSANTPD